MSRRRGSVLSIVSILCMVALVGPRAPRAAHAATLPNVLIILTDDQRDQGTLDVMPNTRQLFEQQGTTFANAFDSTPLCCPARGSLWSGRYSHNHGVLTNGDHPSEERYDQTTTLQYYLSGAGYKTAMVGKYWNTWPLGTPPPYFQRFAMMSGGYNNVSFNVDGVQRTVAGYSTDALGDFAVSDLQSFEATDDQPWLLYVAPQAPHSDFTPATKYASASVPPWQRSPAVLESDRSDKPPIVRTKTTALAEVEQTRAQQLRTLMSVDDMVGQVFAEMDRLGEQDTIAFYLTDNGFMWGEHGQIAKRFPYVDSVSIPMLMRWPGHVTPGATDGRLVAQIDITPTVLQSLGIPPTHVIDGVSLFDPGGRDRMFLEYTNSPDAPNVGSWSADLTANHEYVEWRSAAGAVTFREYYDLVGDPWQLTNLYADGIPGNDPPIAPLSAQLASDRACAGTTCPRPVSGTPDTEPPKAPGQPTGSSTRAGQIDLTWAAATDDRATVLTYRVFRDGAPTPIASVQGPTTGTISFTDTGLAAGSPHRYAVDASDGTNIGPLSPTSLTITVISAPPVIFSDDFSAGLGRWTRLIRATIDGSSGKAAPPSVRATAAGNAAYAYHDLGKTSTSLCMSANIRLNSLGAGAGTALFRLRTAADGPVGRAMVSATRVLSVRADAAGTTRASGQTLALGTWYAVELCGTVGTSGTWRLFLNGTSVLGPWTVNNGTVPIGAINLWENTAKTFSMNVDDVVVDDHPG